MRRRLRRSRRTGRLPQNSHGGGTLVLRSTVGYVVRRFAWWVVAGGLTIIGAYLTTEVL